MPMIKINSPGCRFQDSTLKNQRSNKNSPADNMLPYSEAKDSERAVFMNTESSAEYSFGL